MTDFKTCRFRLTDRFVTSRVGAETVIVPIVDSTAQMGKLVSLNPTSADILEGVREGLGIDGIVDKIMMLYQVTDRETVAADVEKFLDAMMQKGVIEKQ